MINFELISVHGAMYGLKSVLFLVCFIFFAHELSTVPAIFVEKTAYFCTELPLHLCRKSVFHICMGVSLVSLILMSLFLTYFPFIFNCFLLGSLLFPFFCLL